MSWRPIETAPKDGTPIDVWLGDADAEDVQFYCGKGTRRATDWAWIQGKFRPMLGLHLAVVTVTPTHWMPRPLPPTDGRAVSEGAVIDAARRLVAQFVALQHHQHQLLVEGQTLESAAANWDDATLGQSIDFQPLIDALRGETTKLVAVEGCVSPEVLSGNKT